MILECKHCKSPVLIVGEVDPGEVSCPECKDIGTLKKFKIHKKLPDPPTTYAEDVAEILEDEAWDFGDSSSMARSVAGAFAENLSIVYTDDIWESRQRPHTSPNQRRRALYRFPSRTCACGIEFDPNGARDIRCPACKSTYQEARRLDHNKDNRERYKRKKECLTIQ